MSLRVAICITTHNRRAELERTLAEISRLRPQPDEVLVVADGCTDGTAAFVRGQHPGVRLMVHEASHGSIPSRNEMGFATSSDVFLSLDDDSHPIETDAIARIRDLFEKNRKLGVASFPQRSDEHPESLTASGFGDPMFVGSYANSAAAIRKECFEALGGYPGFFFHAYEEPDFALRCVNARWQVRFEPSLMIRHHWTATGRSELRIHQRHSRNELWSVFLHCPMPWLLGVAPFRAVRQFLYACKRGFTWVLAEPVWWWQCLHGLGNCVRLRRALPWRVYGAWMKLLRAPHNDPVRWVRDFEPV
jgi:GT2 family glycosyltransferase